MPSALISRSEAATYLGVPEKSLAAWAYQGRGPSYFRVGKYARYRLGDLDAWLEARRVSPDQVGVEAMNTTDRVCGNRR